MMKIFFLVVEFIDKFWNILVLRSSRTPTVETWSNEIVAALILVLLSMQDDDDDAARLHPAASVYCLLCRENASVCSACRPALLALRCSPTVGKRRRACLDSKKFWGKIS
jgi:hypothetical protein